MGQQGNKWDLKGSGLVGIDVAINKINKRWQQEESAGEGNAWINLTRDRWYITADLVWICTTDQFYPTLKYVNSPVCLLGSVFFLPGCFGDICDK